MKRNHLFLLSGLVVLIISIALLYTYFWRLNQPRNGGPCSYNIINHPAQIISIDTLTNDYYNLNCLVYFESRTDTVSYYLEHGSGIDEQTLEKEMLRIGDSIIYEEHLIIDGSCNPEYYILKVEKFSANQPS